MKMTPEQKRVAEQLTSLFENWTISLHYGYGLQPCHSVLCKTSRLQTSDTVIDPKKSEKEQSNDDR